MFFVYVIRSEMDGRFYVGLTQHTENRILQHNKGSVFSTKGYRPWKLFFTESFSTRPEARKREKYLKSGVGKEYIKNNWPGSSVNRATAF
jgi:putative endonuclease